MKPSALLLAAVYAGLIASSFAADVFRLEPVLYVFREADFRQIQLNSAVLSRGDRGEAFTSPARLSFDQHNLELRGSSYAWDGADAAAPAPFDPVNVPAMVVRAEQEASVYLAAPTQYMEKAPDGKLVVRQLDRNAPDVPHYHLTFSLRPAEEVARLAVACLMQIAVMAGRERIPGVELDVGRPILTRLNENFQFLSGSGEWSGIILRKPGGGEYGLLLLVKISVEPQPASDAATRTPTVEPMTTAQLDEFITHYYLRPRPELIPAAIEALGPSRLLEHVAGGPRDGHFWTFVGFFAEVFAAHPGRVAEWRTLGRKQDWTTRDCLQAALKFSQAGGILAVNGPWLHRPGAIFTLGNSWGSADDARWGAFFASGNPAYLGKVVAQLRDINPLNADVMKLESMWSLARHAPEHPLVRTTLEAARADADPRTRALIDDLLTKDQEAVLQEIAKMAPHRFPLGSYPGPQGLRDMRYFGPVSPGQEIHPR